MRYALSAVLCMAAGACLLIACERGSLLAAALAPPLLGLGWLLAPRSFSDLRGGGR